MPKLLDYNSDVLLRVLPYGDPGTGKTWFGGSAHKDPRTGPCLVLEMGGNAFSLRGKPEAERPQVLQLDGLQDVGLVYDWLSKRQPTNHKCVTDWGLTPGYRTVVYDGITTFQRLSFAKVTGSEARSLSDIPPSVERQHYGAVLGHMTKFGQLFFNLPMHVIVTALEREVEEAGLMTAAPMLLGQAASEVSAYAYVVMRMLPRLALSSNQLKAAEEIVGVGNVVNVGLLQPTNKYKAKDQHGIKKPFLVNPTVTAMLDAMGVPKP